MKLKGKKIAIQSGLGQPGALEYISGVSWPPTSMVSRSLAIAEFSVKSFALFMW